MTKLIRAAVFVLALSVCTQAGVMQADKAQPTPSPTTTATQDETEPAADDTVQDDLIVAAREVALSLLRNLLTLL
ncbi:MAG: hypothetical protein LC800_19395 [Acidobacteria bacterium]|nr:hypothetical protein [Acidobacteriota bacterium]